MKTTRREFLGAGAALAFGSTLGSHLLGCGPGYDFDLCIIGSGFAGTQLGLEAVRAGARTVILEAGSRREGRKGRRPERDFGFETAGEVSWPVNRARAIAVGGTSNHWAGKVNRLRPTDFEMRSRFDLAVDWPLGYDDLDPFYCRAEAVLSTTGYAARSGEPARGCEYATLKPDYLGPDGLLGIPNSDFFGVAQSWREEDAVRLAKAEIPEFEASPLGTLLADTQVIRLVCLDGRTVDHVVAAGPDDERVELRARAFVVASGGVESPRLLLLSTSDHFPAGLGNNHDLVGRNFTVHPTTKLLVRRDRPGGISEGSHRTYALVEPMREQGLMGCSYQLKEFDDYGMEWKAQPEIEPRPQNRVRLSTQERDQHGSPLPVVELTYSERDQRLFEECERVLWEKSEALATSSARPSRRRTFRMHPGGSCRMASDPSTGVVDADCKVFGLENLFVSGACTFPTSGSSNPTLTVVAMAVRLADHLLDRVI